MPKFHVFFERKNSKKFNTKTVEEQLQYIVDRGVAGNRSSWEVDDLEVHDPKRANGPDSDWVYKAAVMFVRKKPRKPLTPQRLTGEMTDIVTVMGKSCTATKWGQYPWTITNSEALDWNVSTEGKFDLESAAEGEASDDPSDDKMAISEIVDFDRALTLDEITIPDVLIHGTDAEIEAYGPFQGIYGRGAHVRVAFSSIATMKATKGRRRNHVLFWGKPGAAKSTMFHAIQMVLGKGAYLGINANSATRAGIEAIFLDRLKETGCPPFLFIEEIEKTLEAILTVWLSILDERREVRKITHHQARRAEANVLCFATANDKVLFDKLMGGRPGHGGALSSRFNKPLYVPRPNRDQMMRILLRDIKLYGGKESWAKPCLDIAEELKETDPRTILGFLDGGDRLLNGKYKADIIAIHDAELNDAIGNKGGDED
jgi:hypothetical protein